MKRIPARIVRACVAHIVQHVPTARERVQMQHIESAGTEVFARHGPYTLSLNRLASEIGVSPHTLGRLYCDREHLLGEILRHHLSALMASLNGIPHNSPNRPARCRAAYRHLIRGTDGRLTDAHYLLVRHFYDLPEDELPPTDALRTELCAMLGAGEIGIQAAAFMDRGVVAQDRVETILAILAEHIAPAKPSRQEVDAFGTVGPQPPAANQNQPRRPPPLSVAPEPPQQAPGAGDTRPPGTVLH